MAMTPRITERRRNRSSNARSLWRWAFHRNRTDRHLVERIGQPELHVGIGLGVIFQVQFGRIAAADMLRPVHRVGIAMEASGQGIDAPRQRLVRLACEERLVDLDPAAAGLGQRQHLAVDGLAERRGERGLVAVVRIGGGIDDGLAAPEWWRGYNNHAPTRTQTSIDYRIVITPYSCRCSPEVERKRLKENADAAFDV